MSRTSIGRYPEALSPVFLGGTFIIELINITLISWTWNVKMVRGSSDAE